jgi:[ribosomal protein S5]-alanine N-acetyltransferase
MSAWLCLPVQTARLMLRDFVAADLPALHACTSDPAVTRYMYYAPMTEAQTREYLLELLASQMQRPRMRWDLAVVRTGDGEVLGACDITCDERGGGDVGYILARSAWGQGYASEAARAMVGQGFEALGLKRIDGMCHADHGASARVLEKAGLRRHSLHPKLRAVKGESWDMLLYSRSRDSWLEEKAAQE